MIVFGVSKFLKSLYYRLRIDSFLCVHEFTSWKESPFAFEDGNETNASLILIYLIYLIFLLIIDDIIQTIRKFKMPRV